MIGDSIIFHCIINSLLAILTSMAEQQAQGDTERQIEEE